MPVARSSVVWLAVVAMGVGVGAGVLAHLREGDLHGAEHGIADLLGLEGD